MLVIAELSGNHKGSLKRALQLIDLAAEAGVDAVKIQTYTADTMTLDLPDGDFKINDPKSLWNGYSLHQLYQKASTPWDWHHTLFQRCREKGIVGFSSPFDESAVDFLESLNVPLYKVASFEIVDIPLIQYIAKTGKPIIISTGLASISEIKEAVDAAKGCSSITLLKCSSTYPASVSDCNLMTIADMKKRFGVTVGFSDHTLGIGVAIASVALGAEVIEKHITLSKTDGAVDSAFSLEPHEFKVMVDEIKNAKQSLGEISYNLSIKEQHSLQFRRSMYISKDVLAGEVLTKDHVRRVRPGFGASPKHYQNVLGKKVLKSMKRGDRLCLENVNM